VTLGIERPELVADATAFDPRLRQDYTDVPGKRRDSTTAPNPDVEEWDEEGRVVRVPAVLLFLGLLTVIICTAIVAAAFIACIQPDLVFRLIQWDVARHSR
jgi:hypothetical protein